MENKNNLNEPCYVQNAEAKNIETILNINGHKIEIKQRRLTGEEIDNHLNNMKDVYTDKDIYNSLISQDDFEKKLEHAKKEAETEAKKQGKKVKEIEDILDLIEIPVDSDTKYLQYKGRAAMEKSNRNINALFIAYSSNDSFLDVGYFKCDGKIIDFETKLKIIKELSRGLNEDDEEINYFDTLLENADKLTYPTQQEVNTAKS